MTGTPLGSTPPGISTADDDAAEVLTVSLGLVGGVCVALFVVLLGTVCRPHPVLNDIVLCTSLFAYRDLVLFDRNASQSDLILQLYYNLQFCYVHGCMPIHGVYELKHAYST